MAYDPFLDRCATCIHFQLLEGRLDGGECHRFPPVFITRPLAWAFPLLAAGNTCGEHTPHEEDHEQTCH